jgi:hypothetical protein
MTSKRNYQLELDFRRAVRHVPRQYRPRLRGWIRGFHPRDVPHRPSLRTWLRHIHHYRARKFYELDPGSGQWRRL